MGGQTELCGIKLRNPTILASGIMGVTGASLIKCIENGAGAVTCKSISLEERKGHPNPILVQYEHGFLNAVGLSSAGAEGIKELDYYKRKCKEPLIASIFAPTAEDFGDIAREVSKAKPDFIEANISCPNVQDEFGKPFATDPGLAAEVTRIVKKNSRVPVIVKLSPNVGNIKEIAQAVEKAGADIINAINTAGPGMAIDIRTAKPVLANKSGGISGPAIKPIAVKCVYDIREAVKVPIIGTGGITTGEDAIEIIMAGASAVGIGTAVYYRGIDVFKKVAREIEEFMEKEGYARINDMMGIAHD